MDAIPLCNALRKTTHDFKRRSPLLSMKYVTSMPIKGIKARLRAGAFRNVNL